MKFNPTFRSTIKVGDTLIALGETPKLKALEAMAKSPEVVFVSYAATPKINSLYRRLAHRGVRLAAGTSPITMSIISVSRVSRLKGLINRVLRDMSLRASRTFFFS